MVQAHEHVSDATLSDILCDADMAAQVQMVVSGKMIGRHPMLSVGLSYLYRLHESN